MPRRGRPPLTPMADRHVQIRVPGELMNEWDRLLSLFNMSRSECIQYLIAYWVTQKGKDPATRALLQQQAAAAGVFAVAAAVIAGERAEAAPTPVPGPGDPE